MVKNFGHYPGKFASSHGAGALRIVGWTFVGVAFAVVFALIFGVVVMALWNWLMPMIFGLGKITFWQAFGIVLLAKLLFGGFGHRYKDYNHFPSKFRDKWPPFKGKLKEDDWMIEGWKYYKEYWQEEGKAAFEDYLQRKKEQEERKNEE